jgi:hypothetical protein
MWLLLLKADKAVGKCSEAWGWKKLHITVGIYAGVAFLDFLPGNRS